MGQEKEAKREAWAMRTGDLREAREGERKCWPTNRIGHRNYIFEIFYVKAGTLSIGFRIPGVHTVHCLAHSHVQ